MSAQTTLELGAIEAIKRSHRTLREAVHTVLSRLDTTTEPGPTQEESNEAFAVIGAITPILECLTGQRPEMQVAAAFKRLHDDGRIPALPRPMESARCIVLIAENT
jgi:hypothetical protein